MTNAAMGKGSMGVTERALRPVWRIRKFRETTLGLSQVRSF